MSFRTSETAAFSAPAAADFLLHHFASDTAGHPDMPGPRTRADAYAIQDCVTVGLGSVRAWKVGRAKDNPEPYCAPIPHSRIIGSGAHCRRRDGLARVEAELALRLARDVAAGAGPCSRTDCLGLVDAVVPAIEILKTRLAGPAVTDSLWKLADLQGNGGLVLGCPEPWTGQDLRTPRLALDCPGRACVPSRQVAHPFGDPIDLLAWTINHVAAERGGLGKGDVIITGSYCGILDVSGAGLFRAAFEGFAPVSLGVI